MFALKIEAENFQFTFYVLIRCWCSAIWAQRKQINTHTQTHTRTPPISWNLLNWLMAFKSLNKKKNQLDLVFKLEVVKRRVVCPDSFIRFLNRKRKVVNQCHYYSKLFTLVEINIRKKETIIHDVLTIAHAYARWNNQHTQTHMHA